MKKYGILLILIFSILTACNNIEKTASITTINDRYITEETKISDTEAIADYNIPTSLKELKERASHIVSVKAIQDLGDDVIDGIVYGSKKEVEILKGHKNELKKGDKIIVIEPAYVEDGAYVGTENYIKMENGSEYTLFLIQGDNANEYGIVGLAYGKFSNVKKSYKGELKDFKYYKELKDIDFIADHSEEIEAYEQLKTDVYNEFK